MKNLLFILMGILPLITSAQEKITTAQYIDLYSSIAITEMEKYNIPASVKLGQGILESASGNSDLAKNARNHFGIKCKKTWTGDTYTMDDDEKNECFRKYDNVLASYEDHSQFLKGSARYAELFGYDKDDYKSWAIGLKKAGYATNPAYTQLLIKTIEDNRLFEFDKPGTRPSFQVPKNETVAEPTISKPMGKGLSGSDLSDFELKKAGQRSVMVRNDVKYVIAKQGDSFESLAKELDMMKWQLPKYNDLPQNEALKNGDIIYLQPKRRKAAAPSHTVKVGETMRDISQLYAIKLSRLYSLNGLSQGTAAKPGTTLKMK